MNRNEARDKTWHVVRKIRRLSKDTADAYSKRVFEFVTHCRANNLTRSNEEMVVNFPAKVVKHQQEAQA